MALVIEAGVTADKIKTKIKGRRGYVVVRSIQNKDTTVKHKANGANSRGMKDNSSDNVIG
jgi:hypothetical protein